MSSSAGGSGTAGSGTRHAAGAYDVRNVIGGLIGFYGVVLVIMGIVSYSEDDAARTGDVNANLWAGIGMVVFGVAFAVWTKLRPVVVDKGADVTGDTDDAPPSH
jgi:hypothetical protein